MLPHAISKLDLKRINRAEILRIICAHGPTSRIDLASQLHLTRAAVTIISAEMIEQGILCERGDITASERAGRGRKKVLLDLCDNHGFCFGAVIDHRFLHLGLTTIKGDTMDRRKLSIEGLTVEEVVQLLYEQVKEIMRLNCLHNPAILGLGICLSSTALTLFPKQAEQVSLATLRRMTDIRFSIPVIVSTTTAGLAMAEHYLFPQQDKPASVLFLRYDEDLDAAIMIGGKLYQEDTRPSNWLSHIVVDPHGDYCTCGKIGCCSTKMATSGMVYKIKDAYHHGNLPLLFHQTQGHIEQLNLSMDNLEQLLCEEVIQQLYREAFQYLLATLDTIITVLNPDQIFLFGYIFELMDENEPLLQLLDKSPTHPLRKKIARAHITEDQLYLAGCGQCVKHFFVDMGGIARS